MAHLLKPKGGMYGCHRLPAGWKKESPPKLQPRPSLAPGPGPLQVGQQAPSSMIGAEQLVGGHTIGSHWTFPRWQLGTEDHVINVIINVLV